MMRLDECIYCGRIFEVIRSDKKTCDGNCSSKYVAAKHLGRETPKQIYDRLYRTGGGLENFTLTDNKEIKQKEKKKETIKFEDMEIIKHADKLLKIKI
jgi:hypothetical protein